MARHAIDDFDHVFLILKIQPELNWWVLMFAILYVHGMKIFESVGLQTSG